MKYPIVLPTFRGYTVDIRLREFRKCVLGKPLEFIDFDSVEGDHLLAEYLDSLFQHNQPEWKRVTRMIF